MRVHCRCTHLKPSACLSLSQMAAIRGLKEMQPATLGVVNTLRAAMENPALFCRVRMEAAAALAASAGTEFNGAVAGL